MTTAKNEFFLRGGKERWYTGGKFFKVGGGNEQIFGWWGTYVRHSRHVQKLPLSKNLAIKKSQKILFMCQSVLKVCFDASDFTVNNRFKD